MNFSLPSFSLRHPVTVLMTLAAIVGLGVIAAYQMPLKFLPEMDFPFIGTFIPYPGATPEQVEREIAMPAEGEFRTIPGLKRISSISNSEGCRVNLRFETGVEMSTASAEVRDRIERLKLSLPKDVDRVFMFRHSSSSIPIMAVGLFRAGDEVEFVHMVRTVIQPRLARIDGVAEVLVFASKPDPEVLVEFDQNRLRNHNIALYEVIASLQTANLNLSVGELFEGPTKYYVRVTDELRRPEAIANLVISPTGLRLKEVAAVGFRTREMESHYDIDDKGGAFVIIRKESESNTIQTCERVRQEIERIKKDPSFVGMEHYLFFDQSELILTALNGLLNEGKGGAMLSVIVLYLFLLRLRPTLVVTLAIPTSLIAALGFMYFVGMTLNVVTMISLIVAVGMLVDDAIVVIENIYRHHQLGENLMDSAERGASEVVVAVTASTITAVVVFIPVLYLQGSEMAVYMKQFAVPMGAALFASLFVAFTLIPLATSRMKDTSILNLFRKATADGAPRPAHWWSRSHEWHPVKWIIQAYAWSLDLTLRYRLVSVLVIIGLGILTLLIPFRHVGMQDMPTLDLKQVDVRVDFDQNFDLAMADDIMGKIKAAINAQREELGIKNVFSRYDASGGQLEVYLKKPEDYPRGQPARYSTEDALNILWERLPTRMPGVQVKLSTPEAGEGEQARTISVRLRGDDSAMLAELAGRFKTLMAAIPDVSDARVDEERIKQEVQLQVDGPRADFAGISPLIIARTVDVALRGARLPYMKQGGREFPVWAQFREEDRKSRDNLDNVSVIGSKGTLVPLNQLVTFSKAQSASSIYRVDGKNVSTVMAKISTDDLSRVQKDLNRIIASFELPMGFSIDLGDEFVELTSNVTNFLATLSMAIILIYIVMAALFESLLLPLSILMSVPLAFIGVYWGMYFTGTALDTIGFIGCILMVGVVVRNGIVIVDHINLLRSQGMARHAAVVQGGRDRFRPVMMTALTTILGVLPLAITATAGSTVSFVSLGRAFVSGLTTGTILTLVIVPLLYTLIEDLQEWCISFVASLTGLRQPKTDLPAPAALRD